MSLFILPGTSGALSFVDLIKYARQPSCEGETIITCKGAVHVFKGVKVASSGRDSKELVQCLFGKNFQVLDLAENEMAKAHIRHLVGGHAPLLNKKNMEERVFRFKSPWLSLRRALVVN